MKSAPHSHILTKRERDFRVVFIMSFPLFVVGALAERMIPQSRPVGPMPRRRRGSIFAEAKAAAYRTLPYAF
ncbi:hypothetical protein [Acuticoccus kandeliae]|uniref:hypothetical protein n=1 Tax=Acuticoccus kandeliae TaxID=2073160 RepID=UPI001300426B|nr:hypothetical protein [Acuticoccus kandeliae]